MMEKTERMNIRLNKSLIERLDKEAEKKNISRSALIRLYCAEALEKEEKR